MTKTKNNKHVGEIYYNNQNELIRIVEYYKYQDVTVEWEDGTRREHVQYGHLRAGKCPRPERMQQRERKPSLIKPQPVRIKTTTTPNDKQSRWKISLSEAYPDIAKQWHPQKNFPHTPEQYTPGSSHKACWQCEKGHEWVTTIRERTRGSQCPFCSNHKVLVGYNDLTTTHPNVAKEWHSTKNGTLQPIEFLAGSDQKVWWQCPICGHEWEARIYLRTKNRGHGTGCPHCSNQTSFNEQACFYYIQQMCPDAVNRQKVDGKEADVLIPSIHTAFEYDGWLHNETRINADIQKARHMQQRGLCFIRIREPACPVLPQNIGEVFILPSAALSDLEGAIRWVLQKLQQINPQLTIPNVDLTRDEPIICSLLTHHKHEHSLAYLHPELCVGWDYEKNGNLTPEMVLPHSRRQVFWKCKNGHSYSASPRSRMRSHGACPRCYTPGSSHKRACCVQYADGAFLSFSSVTEAETITKRSRNSIRKYCNHKGAPPQDEQWSWVE